jgi:adenylate cyclase
MSVGSPTSPEVPMAACFVDIVGYTAHSKTLTEAELAEWVEYFEQQATDTVVEHGGRVIKTIGDEILFTADDPAAAAEMALTLTERGRDEEDAFPAVRAGLAWGDVLSRLGDVYGPTVNVASRLTSVARPGTVVVDRGMYDALTGGDDAETGPDDPRLKRLRRVSVKGYSRLEAWRLRRPKERDGAPDETDGDTADPDAADRDTPDPTDQDDRPTDD